MAGACRPPLPPTAGEEHGAAFSWRRGSYAFASRDQSLSYDAARARPAPAQHAVPAAQAAAQAAASASRRARLCAYIRVSASAISASIVAWRCASIATAPTLYAMS